ncbi:MAG: presqualene diphosphate synthase HpnD [Gammaproteobacteria bacterium]|nr:presqualene diphosphate synthase HpnD [Gammaproteobacteria bacterium]
MTPDQYCQDKAAKSGSSFYYSFLFLPEEQRKAIIALYAFCREVDDIVDECSEASIARVKLQWWRSTMQQTFDGSPQHPVQVALTKPLQRFNLPLEYFLEIIDGMEMDLDNNRYATFKDLSLYCYRVAGVVGLLAAEIFGYQNHTVRKYALYLGTAFQLTNILRDVREDALRNRIYIPQDEIQQFGISEEDILNTKKSDPMQALLKHQSARTHDYYQKAFDHLPEQDRYTQRSGLIMATIYLNTLKAIEQDSDQVLDQRVSLTPIKKLWLAWQTSRIEKKRHKKYLQTCHT